MTENEMLQAIYLDMQDMKTDIRDLKSRVSGIEMTLENETNRNIRIIAAEQKNANRLISNNKKAYFDYFIEDKYEAGLVLHGTEVKSIRMGKCSIKEAYIQIQNGEVFINNMNITPYEKGNIFNKDPLRPKKLLLHQSEINKLAGQIAQKGYTIVPLQVYLSKGRVKMEIGLGRGKKLYDKRDSIAKKDQKREAEKEFKVRNLY